MFAANADFQIGLDDATAFRADPHQLADALGIEHLKRIVGKNLAIDIRRQEATRIVATQTERRLRQIVCAEREKLRMRRDLVSSQCSARQFDHRANQVFEFHAVFAHDFTRDFVNNLGLLFQLFAHRDQRHHDFERHLFAFTFDLAGSLEDRATLHPRNFRVEQAKTATAKTEHRIGFTNLVHVTKQVSLFIDLIKQVIHLDHGLGLLQPHLQFG